MKFFTLVLATAFLLTFPASAQEPGLPRLPDPIQNLINDGAQIRYLGNELGYDAWLTIKNGQEQYFYVKPDRSAFVMGVLFDETGKAITVRQIQRLQQGNDPLLDELTADVPPAQANKNLELSSPAEQLFQNIQNSNWVALGAPKAPAVYSFIDPQCPHCHAFINNLRQSGHLDAGHIQLRMIPVGFRPETISQAAFLLAAPAAGTRFLSYMDGDESALPAKSEINTQGVQRNLAIMQAWEFNVTPMIVYRDAAGTVKIVRGRPKDLDTLIADLPQGG